MNRPNLLPRPGGAWPDRWPSWTPYVFVAAGLLANVALLVFYARDLWFWADDWAFMFRRGVFGHHALSIWFPHNEHWSTVPILIYRSVFALVGFGSYHPYALMPIVAHLIIWAVMFALLRRVGVDAWPAAVTSVACGFLASGVGADDTLWDFQIGFLAAGACGMIGLFVAQGTGVRRLALTWVFLTLALMSAGMGLVMTGLVTCNVLIRKGLWAAFVTAGVPMAILAGWYLAIGRHSYATKILDFSSFPAHMAEGLAGTWDKALMFPGASAVVLAALACTLLFRRTSEPEFALAAAGLAAYVGEFMLIGFTRSTTYVGGGAASRYLYFGVLFSAPGLALLLKLAARQLAERRWVRPLGSAAALIVAAAMALGAISAFATEREAYTRDLKTRLAAAIVLADSGVPIAAGRPDPYFNPDITLDDITQGPVRAALAHTDVDKDDLFKARWRLQVNVSSSPDARFPAARSIEWVGFQGSRDSAERLKKCESRSSPGNATLVIAVPRSGASFFVTAPKAVQLTTQLEVGGRLGDEVMWLVDGDKPALVESSAVGGRVVLHVPAGRVTVCPTMRNR